MRRTRQTLACQIALGCILVSSGAMAEPLAKEACEAAATERAVLLAAGVHETVKKGPEWAKANLPPAKLKDIERFIGLQETMLFRCGEAKLRALPTGGDGEDGTEAQAPKDAAPAAAAAAKVAAPQAQRKAQPKVPAKKTAKPDADAGDGAAPAKAAARPKPKPKPKPKVDDAYRPPQPSGQAAVE